MTDEVNFFGFGGSDSKFEPRGFSLGTLNLAWSTLSIIIAIKFWAIETLYNLAKIEHLHAAVCMFGEITGLKRPAPEQYSL